VIDAIESLATRGIESDRKRAQVSRTFALFEIAINTAIAIMKAAAQFPLNWPGIAAGLTALGAAQAAAVLAQPLPAAAEGGVVTGPTPVLVGEGGQPEVIFPLDELEDFLSGSDEAPMRIIVNLDGTPILDRVAEATRNRELIIDARSVV